MEIPTLQATSGIVIEQHVADFPDAWPRGLDGDARWRLAQRVVASRQFVRSPLLSRFLLYVVIEALEGRQAEITEHQIGVQVFGRPVSYRTVEDNIVRNYARQLRKRLAEYFADASEAIRIEIPSGKYVPVFTASPGRNADDRVGAEALLASLLTPGEACATNSVDDISANSAAERGTPGKNRRRLLVGLLGVVGYSVLLVMLTWLVLSRLQRGQTGPTTGSESAHALWHALLEGRGNTYIVPPDAGFNLIEDIAQQSVPLAEYIHSSYRELPLPRLDDHSRTDLRAQQLTDFVDVQIVARILRLPESNPDHVLLRFPRDLRLDDLKNANAILIGSVCSNPWAAVKGGDANFVVVCGDGMQGSSIVNRKPAPGEQASYASRWNEPTHVTYALISFVPNLSGGGHLLLLEGLDVAGTQAAAEAILQSETIAPILRRATRANGSVAPFEVLLRSTSVQANAMDTQVIASRIH
jgi:hypothetical protein